jgi:hypothetical protein
MLRVKVVIGTPTLSNAGDVPLQQLESLARLWDFYVTEVVPAADRDDPSTAVRISACVKISPIIIAEAKSHQL